MRKKRTLAGSPTPLQSRVTLHSPTTSCRRGGFAGRVARRSDRDWRRASSRVLCADLRSVRAARNVCSRLVMESGTFEKSVQVELQLYGILVHLYLLFPFFEFFACHFMVGVLSGSFVWATNQETMGGDAVTRTSYKYRTKGTPSEHAMRHAVTR